MGIRPKLFLIFFLLGIAPMLLLCVMLYWNGVRSVEKMLRADVESDAAGLARKVEDALRKREASLIALAKFSALRDHVRGVSAPQNSTAPSSTPLKAADKISNKSTAIPKEVEAEIRAFLLSNPKHYSSITCLNAQRQPLFRAELVTPNGGAGNAANDTFVRFQVEDFLSSTVNADEQVWTTPAPAPLRSSVTKESFGATVRYTIPVFTGEVAATAPRGALIAELNGDELLEEAVLGIVGAAQNPANGADAAAPQIIMLNRAGHVLYHTKAMFRYQQVNERMPSFGNISGAMVNGESGWKFYDDEEARFLVAYRPTSAGLSVAVASNHTAAVRDVQRLGWIGVLLSALFGLATAAALTYVVRRTARSIERVTEGAVAIAGGKLDQRIEVRSSDETRLLAESFNIMTDRLREQIARETESRQFESFMRLSAMLTHDLKNAIAALSLLVNNMEKQFDRAEFRADAMKSLTEATDKLRALVSKLSEPVQSLSSEHQLPSPTDLVPVIRRVLDTLVEPVRSLHQIETQLPETLVATVEADRVEKVFENLVLNALEAMGTTSGKLTVAAGPTAHGEVFFTVADTGPGMSEEFKRKKLFRAFATTKRRGVGLGLYTCREIVRAHGGHIDVESQRGSGTTFRVVLPSQQKFLGRG